MDETGFGEGFENAIRRMRQAGWMDLQMPVSSKDSHLPLNEKGMERQREILRALHELDAASPDRMLAADFAYIYAILRAYAPPSPLGDDDDEKPGNGPRPHGYN